MVTLVIAIRCQPFWGLEYPGFLAIQLNPQIPMICLPYQMAPEIPDPIE